MEISFLAVLVCAIVSMIVGSIWYGPLFGKAWMEIVGMDESMMNDPVKKKEMQKRMMPVYALQFVISIIQIWVLGHYIALWEGVSGAVRVLPIIIGFIAPTLAMSLMWSSMKRELAWKSFFVQTGYYLVTFVIYGLILVAWN